MLAAREIGATLAALEAVGASPTYHQIDIRNTSAFGALIERIYAQSGRLDGVVHGAGVIEDKLASEKTSESFARVFETKVNGALAIAKHVRKRHRLHRVLLQYRPRHSVTAGNPTTRLPTTIIDRLALMLKKKLPARVLSINWGPWGGAGMVSPELAREYAARGIGLIEPDAGVASFFDELLHLSAEDAQVILMRGDPSALQ